MSKNLGSKSDSLPVHEKYKCFAASVCNKSERETTNLPNMYIPRSQFPSNAAQLEDGKVKTVVGEMVEIKSVGQCCHPVRPVPAPFHRDPLRMAFHYSSTDNNRRISVLFQAGGSSFVQ